MKVLLIGSGGREHALAWKILQSPRCEKLYVAPGNGATSKIAENINISTSDIEGLVKFAKEKQIDLTVVAPDDPLALGLIDRLNSEGLRAWGPVKAAAQVEWSKSFSKNLMAKHNIPTAEFKVFKDFDQALGYVKEKGAPIVVKASGLALGKGVAVCRTIVEAEEFLKEIMLEKKFGESGSEVVVEEFLVGPEISIRAFCDGQNAVLFPSAQDHKTVYDNGMGPNTGGMGTIAPVPWVQKELLEQVQSVIVKPTLQGLKEVGEFKGCLYPGLIITSNGPKVLEFNARLGDPETQSFMRLLENDILDIFDACIDRTLDKISISWKKGFAACIVVASGGYPGDYKKGLEITGIDEAEKLESVVVFHAGTKYENGKLVTNGGRVLAATATGDTLQEALDKAYNAVSKIHFEGMHYRKDIGKASLTYKV